MSILKWNGIMDNLPNEHIPSNEDMERLAAGDESVVNDLISGLIGFVINEVDWFIRNNAQFLNLKDDLIGESLLALTEFVNKSLGKNFTAHGFIGYVKKECLGAVKKWVVRSKLPVSIPPGSLFHHDGREWSQDKINKISSRQLKISDIEALDGNLFSEIWFNDFIDKLSDLEQQIMQLKIEGLSNRKIAKKLNKSSDYVGIKLLEIAKKYTGE